MVYAADIASPSRPDFRPVFYRKSRVGYWLYPVLLILFLLFPDLSRAHSNEYLATIEGPHGGQVRMAEMYHFEALVRDGELQIWVTDHGNNPQATAGATGNALIILDTQRVTVKLVPSGPNGLSAKDARIKANGKPRIVLTVAMKGQQPLQTRFFPNEDGMHMGKHQ